MAMTGWPLKDDTWGDDVFLLVSNRLSCHRSTRARCIEPALARYRRGYQRLLYCRNLRATLRQHFLAYRGRTQAASALPIYGGVD
jgi:hypothetical protein